MNHAVRRERSPEDGAPSDGAPSAGREPTVSGGAGPFGFLLAMLVGFLLLFGVVRPFVAEPFRIPSESMSPTLEAGDSVLAAKFAYRFAEPERGDVVVFEGPDGGGPTIKRVVGVTGDTVAVRDGVLVVNGERMREGYVDYGLTDSTFFGPTSVPEDHVFVMGDYRTNSLDSRSFGPVPEEDLLGRVVVRIWPPDRLGTP